MTEADYDAELRDWVEVRIGDRGNILLGTIYNDTKGRFKDGEHIRTSVLKDIDHGIATTRNTRYLLGPKGKAIASS